MTIEQEVLDRLAGRRPDFSQIYGQAIWKALNKTAVEIVTDLLAGAR